MDFFKLVDHSRAGNFSELDRSIYQLLKTHPSLSLVEIKRRQQVLLGVAEVVSSCGRVSLLKINSSYKLMCRLTAARISCKIPLITDKNTQCTIVPYCRLVSHSGNQLSHHTGGLADGLHSQPVESDT